MTQDLPAAGMMAATIHLRTLVHTAAQEPSTGHCITTRRTEITNTSNNNSNNDSNNNNEM